MDAIPKRCFSPKSTPKIWTFLTLLLVPSAIWCQISFYILSRPDRLLTFFHETKKDFFKDSFNSEILVKIKEVHFSFFYLFQITFDGLFIFCMFEALIISLATKALRTQCLINAQMGYCRFTNIFCDGCTTTSYAQLA